MVLNYMQTRRSKKRENEDLSTTLPLPVYGKNFADDVKTRVRLVIDNDDPHPDVPDDLDPDNAVPNGAFINEVEVVDQEDEVLPEDEVIPENEVIPEDEQEEIDGVIYPDDAVQRRRKNAPLNYALLHSVGRR